MSIHFVELSIKEVRRETPECVSVLFDVPAEWREQFAFTHGQNLTIKTIVDETEIRRSYSICSAPYENELRIAVKAVEAGLFSTLANKKLRPGDRLQVLPPTGKFFTALDSSRKKKYLAFAAGSGITPVISIIKTTLRTEPHSTFTLVYGNKRRSSIIFLEELEGLKNTYMDRFNLVHVLSRERTDSPLNAGRIDAEKCAMLSKLIEFGGMDEIFICGPASMIFSVKDWCEHAGIPPGKIHFELFTTPAEMDNRKNARSLQSSGGDSNITIKLDGITFDFRLAFEGDSILDAALKQGADLPYACKGGVCGTCRARLKAGEVEMDAHWALEPEEIEQGYILTCQSHPKSETVVVDYDDGR